MLPLFAGTTGRDSKRHQPLPVVARRLCPYHSCRVPFARNSPFGCFAQKVPDTYLSLIAKQGCRNDSAELCLAVLAIATVKCRSRGCRQGGSFNRMTPACLLKERLKPRCNLGAF